MKKNKNVRYFTSFKQENEAEQKRCKMLKPEESLKECAILQDRKWGIG